MVKPAAGHRPLAYSSPEAVQTTGTVADIGRCPGTAFTDRRDSTVHDHAEIFIAICSVFAGLDICVTVEPLDRLLKWRELGYHNALHALILVGVEHLGWTIRDEHIDILGVDRRRLLPVTLESGTVVHRLADINKIARHSIRLLNSLASGSAPRSRCPSQRVNTVFPVVWPAIIEPIASRASAIGITTPTSGWMPAVTMKLIVAFISSSVPMMVPRMLICSTNMRSRSVSATPPVDAFSPSGYPPGVLYYPKRDARVRDGLPSATLRRLRAERATCGSPLTDAPPEISWSSCA